MLTTRKLYPVEMLKKLIKSLILRVNNVFKEIINKSLIEAKNETFNSKRTFFFINGDSFINRISIAMNILLCEKNEKNISPLLVSFNR